MNYTPLEKPVPVSRQTWPASTFPLVSVWCAIYQHERYLERAIESFLMQETTFPVQIILHDDASTDSSAAIIQQYAQRFQGCIVPIVQSVNLFGQGKLSGVGPLFRPHSKGKYIAVCDGDDFWVSPDKLQKQVSLMESDSGISLTFHQVMITNSDGDIEVAKKYPKTVTSVATTSEILESYSIVTCSVVVREPIEEGLVPHFSGKVQSVDWALWLLASLRGRIVGLPDCMAAYRQHASGMWTGSRYIERACSEYDLWRGMHQIMPARFRPQIRNNLLKLARGLARDSSASGISSRHVLLFVKLGYLFLCWNRGLLKPWFIYLSKAFLGEKSTHALAKTVNGWK